MGDGASTRLTGGDPSSALAPKAQLDDALADRLEHRSARLCDLSLEAFQPFPDGLGPEVRGTALRDRLGSSTRLTSLAHPQGALALLPLDDLAKPGVKKLVGTGGSSFDGRIHRHLSFREEFRECRKNGGSPASQPTKPSIPTTWPGQLSTKTVNSRQYCCQLSAFAQRLEQTFCLLPLGKHLNAIEEHF